MKVERQLVVTLAVMIAMGIIFCENSTLKIVLILLTFVMGRTHLIDRTKELFYCYGMFITLFTAGFYL